MPNWRKIITSGSDASLNSLVVTNGITGSLQGTASYATQALSSSFAVSASWAPAAVTPPGGSNTSIQFNSSSAFSGNNNFTYDYTLNSLKQGLNVLASGSYSHAQGTNTVIYPNTTLITTSSTFVGFDFNSYGIVSITTSSIIVSGDVQGEVPSIPYTLTSFQLDSTTINLTYYGDHIITSASYDGSADTTFFIALSSSYDQVEINTLNASGSYSHAEGFGTLSIGLASHAEGYKTNAIGNFSHAEGENTTASGSYSHAEGRSTLARGSNSHAEGSSTQATGANSHAEGQNTLASNQASHAEGIATIASGQGSHAEGVYTTALGNFSHAEGYGSYAFSDYSHGEGYYTSASGDYSHAEGRETKANNTGAHAEGRETNAVGQYSHTEGHLTYTLGNYSHAEGFYTTASAAYAHAEGRDTIASGIASHAEGSGSISVGEYSHAEGLGTISSGSYQLAIGQYNTQGNDSSLFIIGNGASAASRSDLALFNKTNIDFKQNTLITGSLNVSGGITGSLLGTASHATSIGTLTQNVTINGNLNVTGTASFTYTTASQLDVGTNIITVNTNNTLRYGGLAVIDSGSSPQRSGSLLFDSQNNQWIFVHQSPAGDVTSSVLIMGPQTFNNIGNETTITVNRLTKGTGGDLGEHIGDSNITDTGTLVTINSNTVITGSLRGNVTALTISSNTASVDMSSGSFFTLALANGAATHINPTNINPGQTVNIRVTQGSAGTGTVSFPNFVDQPSGSPYTGSAVANAIDIVTLLTFDSTTVFLSSVRNMI